jgi:hypothetical protein
MSRAADILLKGAWCRRGETRRAMSLAAHKEGKWAGKFRWVAATEWLLPGNDARVTSNDGFPANNGGSATDIAGLLTDIAGLSTDIAGLLTDNAGFAVAKASLSIRKESFPIPKPPLGMHIGSSEVRKGRLLADRTYLWVQESGLSAGKR